MWYHEGQELISIKNLRKLEVSRSQIVTIEGIGSERIRCRKPDGDLFHVPNEVLGDCFEPAYAVTVYRYRGDKTEDAYNILNVSMMNKGEMYTALSRGVTIDNIGIRYTSKKFEEAPFDKTPTRIKVKPFESDPSMDNGLIYGTYKDDELVYVGSTTSLARRQK